MRFDFSVYSKRKQNKRKHVHPFVSTPEKDTQKKNMKSNHASLHTHTRRDTWTNRMPDAAWASEPSSVSPGEAGYPHKGARKDEDEQGKRIGNGNRKKDDKRFVKTWQEHSLHGCLVRAWHKLRQMQIMLPPQLASTSPNQFQPRSLIILASFARPQWD